MLETKIKENDDPEEAARVRAPGPWRVEFKALLALGVPMGLTQLVQFSINTVDVLMIGRLGPEALAAAALGLVIFYLFFMLALGPAMALSPLVSQTLGADAKNFDEVRLSVRMGLWVAALILPCSVGISLVAENIALFLGQKPELAARAGPYVMALAPGLPFMIGVVMLRNFLAAIGRTRWPLVFIVGTTFLNGFLNWLLIYGNWGFPGLNSSAPELRPASAMPRAFSCWSHSARWTRAPRSSGFSRMRFVRTGSVSAKFCASAGRSASLWPSRRSCSTPASSSWV